MNLKIKENTFGTMTGFFVGFFILEVSKKFTCNWPQRACKVPPAAVLGWAGGRGQEGTFVQVWISLSRQ